MSQSMRDNSCADKCGSRIRRVQAIGDACCAFAVIMMGHVVSRCQGAGVHGVLDRLSPGGP